MSHGMSVKVTPDDPDARATYAAYEATVAAEGVAAAYAKHFTDDCVYVLYGDSQLAGRYEGKAAILSFWEMLLDRVDIDLELLTSMAGDGIVANIDRFTVTSGDQTCSTRAAAIYETRDGKISSGRFIAFDQAEFDRVLGSDRTTRQP